MLEKLGIAERGKLRPGRPSARDRWEDGLVVYVVRVETGKAKHPVEYTTTVPPGVKPTETDCAKVVEMFHISKAKEQELAELAAAEEQARRFRQLMGDNRLLRQSQRQVPAHP